MRTRNNKNKIDRAICAADNISTGEKTMRNSSKKTPWHLRFAPGALNLKEMATTAGIGTIYGLLFAGILFAPLPLPSGKVQAQCAEFDPNDCANPCYVPPPPPRYSNDEFDAATSREDCDRILQKVLEDIDKRWKEIRDNNTAAVRCDEDYDAQLTTNDLAHKAAYASAANTGKGLLLTCLGLGTPVATGVSARVGWISGGKISITLARVGSGVLGGITFLASLVYCKRLANGAAQDEIDVADKQKKHADNVALRDRNRCREDTNYSRSRRLYFRWIPKSKSAGYYAIQKDRARSDHQKCLALFPVGDCGTTE